MSVSFWHVDCLYVMREDSITVYREEGTMFKSLLLFGGVALLLVGCAADGPLASEDAQISPGEEAAPKLTMSGSRAGGGREVREPAASIGLDRPAAAAPILLKELRFDETLTVHGLELSWLEVNDSRCPQGAVCIWEGEMGILLGVKEGKEDLGSFALTRHHEGDERARVRIGNRIIELVDVGPYPALDAETERAKYTASLAVSLELEVRPLEGGLAVGERPAGGFETGRPTKPLPDEDDFPLEPEGPIKPLPDGDDFPFEPPEEPNELDPQIAEALKVNREQWASQGIDSYQVRFQRSCFCGPDYRRAAVVVVRGGEIASATYADDGTVVEPEFFDRYETIDGLFDLIQKGIEQGAARIDVTYDEKYGYPTDLYIDWHEGMADEEQGFAMGELVVMK